MKLAIIRIDRMGTIYYIQKEFETYNDAKAHAESKCDGFPYEIKFYENKK